MYWVSIGHYEAVAVGNWWYRLSRGHLCLYTLNKVEIWILDRYHGCLTHWQTLKDSATQLLIKYKSGALVTQCRAVIDSTAVSIFVVILVELTYTDKSTNKIPSVIETPPRYKLLTLHNVHFVKYIFSAQPNKLTPILKFENMPQILGWALSPFFWKKIKRRHFFSGNRLLDC